MMRREGRWSDERTMQMALALVERDVLTQPAARAISFFSSRGLFCKPIQTDDGEVSIIFRERCYSPAAWNALVADRYPPTAGDVLSSISALAATPESEPEPPTPDEVVARLRAEADTPPVPGSPEAEEQLEEIHHAVSQRPGGAGALSWGLVALVAVLGGLALLGFWQVAQLIWSR